MTLYGLDSNIFSNYLPLSLLTFISKLLVRVVARQLVTYLETSSLFVSVQSAYRAHNSTETALSMVLKDLLCAVDTGDRFLLSLIKVRLLTPITMKFF